MKDPEYSGYIDSLLEICMTKSFGDPEIDPESYEETRTLLLEVED